MKRQQFLFILLALLLTACQQENDVIPQQQLIPLHIAFADTNPEVQVVTRALPNALTHPSATDYSVSVKGTDGVERNESNANISSILVPSDTYTIKAWYGTNPALAKDAPYYEGTTTATMPLVIDYVNPVQANISCTIANSIVSVQYLHHDGTTPSMECFDQQFEPGYYVEATIDGAEPVRLTNDAGTASTDHVYFRAGTSPTFTFHGKRKFDQQEGYITLATPVVEAGHHLILRLSISVSGDVILISDSENADDSSCLIRPFMNPLTD